MNRWLFRLMCDWTHGGGRILRDDQGRINWRCDKCGRWSDSPVPLDDERRQTDADIRAAIAKATGNATSSV